MRSCANLVVAKALAHNKKMAEKIIELHSLYRSLFKIISEKRNGHRKIEEFLEKLEQTMAFWPRDDEKRKENEKGKSKKEVEAIDEDILFSRSMKTNRIAHYATKDEETVIAAEARSLRKRSVDKALLNQNTLS